jgi:transcriptional regulator with XRE-family HTH domain
MQWSWLVAYVPSIKRHRLGAALRRLREQPAQSTDDVAKSLGWSKSKVSRIETAAVTVTPEDARALLGLYDVLTDEVEQLVRLAREDKQPGWWRQYSEVLPQGQCCRDLQRRLLKENPVHVADVAAAGDVAGHHQTRAVGVQRAAVLAGRQQHLLVLEAGIDLAPGH